MPETPAVQPQPQAQPPAQPQTVALPQALIDALKKSGTRADAVRVYEVPEYVAMELGDICCLPSSRKGCEGESPLMVVQRLAEFPEAREFKGYIGYYRAECATEYGDFVAFTHYMRAEDTGELGPLGEYFHDAVVPFAIRIAKMGTRRGFHVYRPIPATATGWSPTPE